MVQPCDKIYWKEELGNFYCELQPSLDRRELERTFEDYADTIVPLQGFELSWSQNGMSRATETYWHVDSIQKKGHQDYLVKFSDTFFNFFIEVEYVFDTDGNFHITSQKLIQMEQKGLMDEERMAKYSGWGSLS